MGLVMSRSCVIALFRNLDRASVAMKILKADGYQSDCVSLITHADASELRELNENAELAVSERKESTTSKDEPDHAPAARTGAGALMGSAVAVPFAFGSMVFPLFIAGPLLGAGLGAVLGAFGDAEKDLEKNYKSLEEHLRNGAALIVVTDEDFRVHDAKAILQTCDPIRVEEQVLSEK